jgi:hypothetical protein
MVGVVLQLKQASQHWRHRVARPYVRLLFFISTWLQCAPPPPPTPEN